MDSFAVYFFISVLLLITQLGGFCLIITISNNNWQVVKLKTKQTKKQHPGPD